MSVRPQPYRLSYSGDDPRMSKIIQDIDEMLAILFTDLADNAGGSFPSGTGFLVETATDGTLTNRSLVAGTGISISNGSGVSGNPTISATGASTAQMIAIDTYQVLSGGAAGWSVTDANGQ